MAMLLAALALVALPGVSGNFPPATTVNCKDWTCTPGKYTVIRTPSTVEVELDKKCLDVPDKTDWFSKSKGVLGRNPAQSLHTFCQGQGYDTVGQIFLASYPGHYLDNVANAYCNLQFEYLGAWQPNSKYPKSGMQDLTFMCVNKPEGEAKCCSTEGWTGRCYSHRSADNNWMTGAWGGARNPSMESWGNVCEDDCGRILGDDPLGCRGDTEASEACAKCVTGVAEVRTNWNCAESQPSASPTDPPTMPPTKPPTAPQPQACRDAATAAACRALTHCNAKERRNGDLKKCKPKKCRSMNKTPAVCNANKKCKAVMLRGKPKCQDKN